MKIFYVAIYSNFEAENKLFKVSAKNEFEAAKQALLSHAEANENRDERYESWINSFTDMEDLLQQCTNSDLCVSDVIESLKN